MDMFFGLFFVKRGSEDDGDTGCECDDGICKEPFSESVHSTWYVLYIKTCRLILKGKKETADPCCDIEKIYVQIYFLNCVINMLLKSDRDHVGLLFFELVDLFVYEPNELFEPGLFKC